MMDEMRQVLMHFGMLWSDYADRRLGRRNMREDTEYASWAADMEIELWNAVNAVALRGFARMCYAYEYL